MKRLALLVVAVAGTAWAIDSTVAPCGNALCVGPSTPQQTTKLGGDIQTGPGTWADGGVAIVTPVTQGASLVLQGNQTTSDTRPDVVVRSANSRATTAPIFDVQNGQGGKSVFRVTANGITIDGGSGTLGALNVATLDAGTETVGIEIQATDGYHEWMDHTGAGYWEQAVLSVSGEGNNLDNLTWRRSGGANPYFRLDKSTGMGISSFGFAVSQPGASGTDERTVPVAAPTDGGTPSVYIEYGQATASSAVATVTFKNAYTSAPQCHCTQVLDGGCSLVNVPSTTAALFHTASASAEINYICIGQR